MSHMFNLTVGPALSLVKFGLYIIEGDEIHFEWFTILNEPQSTKTMEKIVHLNINHHLICSKVGINNKWYYQPNRYK